MILKLSCLAQGWVTGSPLRPESSGHGLNPILWDIIIKKLSHSRDKDLSRKKETLRVKVKILLTSGLNSDENGKDHIH